MSSELFAVLGIFIAAAALLATTWQGYLLRNQLSYFSRVSKAQFYQQITIMCIQRDQIFIEHPGLRAYFYDGRNRSRRKAQQARIAAMSRILANLADGLASERVDIDFDDHWNKYYQYMYDNSPSFRDFWKEHGRFWPEETRRRFHQKIYSHSG